MHRKLLNTSNLANTVALIPGRIFLRKMAFYVSNPVALPDLFLLVPLSCSRYCSQRRIYCFYSITYCFVLQSQTSSGKVRLRSSVCLLALLGLQGIMGKCSSAIIFSVRLIEQKLFNKCFLHSPLVSLHFIDTEDQDYTILQKLNS